MDAYSTAPQTICVSVAALAASGAATTFTTTGATLYSIGGKAFTTAAAAGAATPTSDAVLGTTFASRQLLANQGTVFVWYYNGAATAAAAIRVAQGTVEALDAAGNFVNAPQFPAVPEESLCPFAYSIVRNGSTGSAWTFGTSNWNATGITLAHVNIFTLPGRPQIS
jgi:hypothetical protein